jgi:hypothetical protein
MAQLNQYLNARVWAIFYEEAYQAFAFRNWPVSPREVQRLVDDAKIERVVEHLTQYIMLALSAEAEEEKTAINIPNAEYNFATKQYHPPGDDGQVDQSKSLSLLGVVRDTFQNGVEVWLDELVEPLHSAAPAASHARKPSRRKQKGRALKPSSNCARPDT